MPTDNTTTDLTTPSSSIEALIARAIDKGVAVETMERLLAMRTVLKQEAAKEAYFAALAALQAELPIIPKSKPVDYGAGRAKYSYAPLDDIVKIVQPYLFKHGFSVMMGERRKDDGLYVVATMHHIEGHSEDSDFPITVDPSARMNVAQQQASARTYAKRYAYCNVIGIVTGDEDDDAHSSGAKPERPTGKLRTEPAPPFPPMHAAPQVIPNPPEHGKRISDSQRRRLYAIYKQAGHHDADVRAWLAHQYHVNHSTEIRTDQYNAICDRLASRAPLNEPEPPPPDDSEWVRSDEPL